MLSHDEAARVKGNFLNLEIPKIYAITDTAISGISHQEQVKRLIDGGIKFIQLREKHASPREFYESAKAAVTLAREHDVTIIINDRVDIALAANADGVHLGQDDLPPGYARNILGADAIIGFSIHSLEQARAALDLPIDYIAIGPVFATTTKENPDAVTGIETIKSVKKLGLGRPLVAIGGINSGNLVSVLSAGADSAAMIGALIARADQITRNAEALISQADRNK